ncbi:MAG: UvrD-helicase domain-containing protein [Spirochaetes bacterium]|nr:UvrD-helicase domain-containing protein [Spirochaetota bacterium]
MELVQKLNEEQYKAVTHINGPLLILAGAGSGKTRVITYRIAHLIKDAGIPPYAIVAVTFTNKAAQEMQTRIKDLIGPIAESVMIKTFHSLAVYILRRHGNAIGIPSNFTIYDDHDQESVIKDILRDLHIDPKAVKPSMIAEKISHIKESIHYIEGGDVTKLLHKFHSFNFHEIFTKYHEKLTAANALDFSDLLVRTVQLLRNKEVLHTLQSRWKYFMIDEYQDTNIAQYLIAKYLSSETKNICVVGDDDQSIYSWRGADIRNILNFEKDYPNATVITLHRNYRSTEPILKAAWHVIKNNYKRKDKKLTSHRGDGEPIIVCTANNEYGEAEYVINTIISLKHKEGYTNKDFAIFYRTNAQSRIFEEYLRKENIPYVVIGSVKFYERKEIKDIMAYMRFIANQHDTVSLLRIINTPARGIGASTIEKIRDAAYIHAVSEWDIIANSETYSYKLSPALASFKDTMQKLIDKAALTPQHYTLSDLCISILNETQYKKTLEAENSIEARGRLENIDAFVNSIFEYEHLKPLATLDEFLQDISLLTPADETNGTVQDAVTLMTVHNAKGLEFPVVFLTGMEEGLFPHANASDTEEGIEEERRLCYVGMTRAKDRLFITSAELRRSWGTAQYKEASRFLSELPSSLCEFKVYNSLYDTWDIPKTLSGNNYTMVPENYYSNTHSQNSDSKFKVHQRVKHPSFGIGTITSIQGKGDNVKLTIRFLNGFTKTFLERYTPLEPVS